MSQLFWNEEWKVEEWDVMFRSMQGGTSGTYIGTLLNVTLVASFNIFLTVISWSLKSIGASVTYLELSTAGFRRISSKVINTYTFLKLDLKNLKNELTDVIHYQTFRFGRGFNTIFNGSYYFSFSSIGIYKFSGFHSGIQRFANL